MTDPQTAHDVVQRCQTVMAHAWMVRTFIKHSDEIDDFPALMGIVRAVFDTSRALETHLENSAGYLKMLRKKIGKLRKAAERFQQDAAEASSHTNFQQAVISIDACVEELESLLQTGESLLSDAANPPPETDEP